MPFKPGQSGNPRGRPVGTSNKVTTVVKDMVAAALEQAGGQDYLARQAEENPSAFLALVGKIIPLQVTGEGGGPVVIVTGVQRAEEKS